MSMFGPAMIPPQAQAHATNPFEEAVKAFTAALSRLAPEIPEGARCEGCSFFWNPNKESICRRRAPVPIVAYAKNQSNSSETGGQTFFEVVGYFPTTDGFGCGEWRQKENPTEERKP